MGGDLPGYGTRHRKRGGRTDADPFWYLKYPEQIERRVGIGVEGDEAIKCGCEGLPGYQTDRWHLHKEIGQLQGRRDAGANPALGRHCALILGLTCLFSQGNIIVWRKHYRVPAGDGGDALVHRHMLPVARRRGDNSGHGGGDGRAVEGDGVDCCGRHKRGP